MTRTTVESGKDGVQVDSLGFLTKDVIKLNLDSGDKNGVVGELVDLLAEKGKIDKKDVDGIKQAILKRESLGSTGIGHGLAIPHAKASPHVKGLVGAFGRSARGIEYGAIDGEPCRLFFLMVSHANGVDAHLKILKRLAGLARDPNFCRFLRDAKDEDEVLQLLKEAEER
jgi:mannitol/fructose-specific phosphotransferase system IIA component (Ntr-type)